MGAATRAAAGDAQAGWAIDRDGPAATTVELPPGKTQADVEAIKALAVPAANASPDLRIEFKALNRGFLLGADYLPGASFVSWKGTAPLTPAAPEAVIWQAP